LTSFLNFFPNSEKQAVFCGKFGKSGRFGGMKPDLHRLNPPASLSFLPLETSLPGWMLWAWQI
jgi:hypothetical protein